MPTTLQIDARARTAAPPEQVWALLADATSWPAWSRVEEAVVLEGAAVGEVRLLRAGRRAAHARLTAFEPCARLAYELVSGLRVRGYRAEVTLEPTPQGGTAIRWRSSFECGLPLSGRLLRRRVQRFVAETAEGLARAAEAGVR